MFQWEFTEFTGGQLRKEAKFSSLHVSPYVLIGITTGYYYYLAIYLLSFLSTPFGMLNPRDKLDTRR